MRPGSGIVHPMYSTGKYRPSHLSFGRRSSALLKTNRHAKERIQFRSAVGTLLLAIFTTTGSDSLATEPATSENDNSSAVRVMSFNIRNGIAKDGPNHWQLRKELVIRTVRDFDPDVLGAQEVRGFQAEFFKENLSDYDYHGTTRVPSNKEEEQCAVFYRKSRFERVQSGHFWLSDTPDVPGSRSWDSAHPRMVSWVQLRERTRPDSAFFVFNTHFDHVGRDARLQSAAILRKRVQKIAGSAPSILVGDFNSDEGSLPYQVLLYSTEALQLKDTYRAQHPTPNRHGETTSSRWQGVRSGRRIDWILSSTHWLVSAAAIDYANHEGRYPSDHYPVNAILVLTNTP